MKKTMGWNVKSVLLFGLGMAYSGLAWSQDPFPDGPEKDTLFLVCVQCHSPTRITNAQLTAADWEFILYDMIARGAPVHQEDIGDLKKYLIDNFAIEQQQGIPASPAPRD